MSSYIEDLLNLAGKTVVITGACGQLGKALCSAYNALGSKVIGLDLDISKNQIEKVDYKKLNIEDNSSINTCFKKIYDTYGDFDVLINNAGVAVFEPFEERDESSFDWVYSVNLKGTFFCIKNLVNVIGNSDSARSVVNIGSVYGIQSSDYRIYGDGDRLNSEIYSATKAGIIQLTKYFAVHLSEKNIRVNCVSPGGIFNPDKPQSDFFIENYSYRNPMKRMANVDEIIGAIIYLSSDAATYTTGHNLVVDGGMTSW